MQDPELRKKIINRVRSDLSKRMRILSVKFHDIVFRKKLTGSNEVCKNFELVRVKVEYKKGRKKLRTTAIIYPCDIVPYVRKSLAVVEEMAREKLVSKSSYFKAGDIFAERYDLDLNSIKSAVKRTQIAFARLLSIGLVSAQDVVCWLKSESRSFSYLNHLYWEKSLEMNLAPLNLFR